MRGVATDFPAVLLSSTSAFQLGIAPSRDRLSSHLLYKSADEGQDEDEYSSYIWKLPKQDGDMVSDLLLEFGAQLTQVVLVSDNGTTTTAWIDWESLNPECRAAFDKTGKMPTESSAVEFSTLDGATAQRLVQGVSDIMDWDATKSWQDCRKKNEEDTVTINANGDRKVRWESADEMEKVYEIQIGNQTLVLSNSIEESWAFGDGNHPSTRVMLTAGLEKYVHCGCSVLDYGCGTGILALSAKALNASTVTAVDISDEALQLARLNLERNVGSDGNANSINILHSEEYIPSTDFDVVVANIPSNTIVTLLGTLEQSMRTTPNAVLLLSGYPASEADMVRKVAREKHGLEVIHEFYDSGWILQVLQHTS